MTRQSITISPPNNQWLEAKVESEQEYATKSEAVNDLIRRAREREEADLDYLRRAIKEGDESGYTNFDPDEVLQKLLTAKRAGR